MSSTSSDATSSIRAAVISTFLQAGAAEGSIRPGLDPDDVLMLMSCVCGVPAGAAGMAQAERLLDLVIGSLAPAPTA